MAYSTQSDLLERISEPELIQLTDDAGAGVIDSAKVTAAIREADATIDAYASRRYNIPLVVTDQVRALSARLAIYFLEVRRRMVREITKDLYERDLGFLKDVAADRVTLGGQVAGVATAQVSGRAVLKDEDDEEQTFSKDRLSEF